MFLLSLLCTIALPYSVLSVPYFVRYRVCIRIQYFGKGCDGIFPLHVLIFSETYISDVCIICFLTRS